MNRQVDPADAEKYHRQGYLVVRGLLSADEVEAYRAECFAKSDATWVGPTDFNGLLISERVVAVLHALLGPTVIMFGDSSCQAGRGEGRHFHIDARDDDFDYSRPYPVLRLGFYLQDHDRFSGGLKLRPGSHRRFIPEKQKFRLLRHSWRQRSLQPLLPPGRSINVDTRAGDLVLWNLRTHHAGFAVRLKQWPQFSLHPAIEDHVPDSWRLPMPEKRCVIFASYGAPSALTDRYIATRWRLRPLVEHWQRAVDADARRLAAARGVEIRQPPA